MRKLVLILAIIMTFTLAMFSFTGCKKTVDNGDGGNGGGGGGEEDVFEPRPDDGQKPYGAGRTLNIYLWADAGAPDMSEIIAEWKKRTADRFAFDIKFTFESQVQYKQNLQLKMGASSDQYDLVFDAPWMFLTDWSQEGYYSDLTKYFNNPNFPGLKKAFLPSYTERNLFEGQDGKKGMYGVPLTENFGGGAPCVIYREDWRLEAVAAGQTSLEEGINTYEQFIKYMDWVKLNKPGVTPFGANKNAQYSPFSIIDSNRDTAPASQYVSAGIKQGITLNEALGFIASAYVNPESNQVVEAILPYEQPGAQLNYPAPFNTVDSAWTQIMTETRSWMTKGYLKSDIQSESDAVTQFNAGQYGAILSDVANLLTYQNAIKTNQPTAQLEIFVADKNLRNRVPGSKGSNFQAWNFLGVPSFSKDKDLSILFLDWLFESRENHDLFQHGIEGKHWDKIDPTEEGGAYEYFIDSSKHEVYKFNAFLLSWNPTYTRTAKGLTKKAAEFVAYANAPSTYVEYLFSDFRFDATKVSAAMSNADIASYQTDHVPYHIGVIADPITGYNAVLNKWYNNATLQEDIKKIKAELIKQLQEYIDSQE